jgi:hypothetical protein
MPRKRSTAEVAAEAGTDETRQFVRRVRRATRRTAPCSSTTPSPGAT